MSPEGAAVVLQTTVVLLVLYVLGALVVGWWRE